MTNVEVVMTTRESDHPSWAEACESAYNRLHRAADILGFTQEQYEVTPVEAQHVINGHMLWSTWAHLPSHVRLRVDVIEDERKS